jgi:hypothetical protein
MERTSGTIHYHSFILRLWQTAASAEDGVAPWYLSLEDPHSAERIGFQNIDELIAYLVSWTGALTNPEAGDAIKLKQK